MTNAPDIKFYDTSALLQLGEEAFNESFLISSLTINELEQIKTASDRDAEIKYRARAVVRGLEQRPDLYEVIIHSHKYEKALKEDYINTDFRILSDAIECNNWPEYQDRVIFVTNDLLLKQVANRYFGNGNIASVPEEAGDEYKGFKEITCTDEQLAKFYEKIGWNHFDLYIGEYVILKDLNGEVVDIRVWTGYTHRNITTRPFESTWFGKITPFKGDIYQKLFFDSLENNKITLVKGPAGSGKTQISLSFLMSQLEHGKLDKIVVFCNTVATANSAKLGFYPGSKEAKLLDSSVGNMLNSKFGGREATECLISENKLVLLPMSDIRGYDTTGMRAGIYLSEAQNLDRTLIKLALQRVGEDSICIIDGDSKTQVDDIHFAGPNNGMRRVSKVFRGQDIYGEVELQNIHRSKIAQIAEGI